MRLHRHDEIVEAIHQVIAPWVSGHDIASAALDAMLETSVKLGVGQVEQADPDWGTRLHTILALRMEARDGE